MIILDTNVISALMQDRPDIAVLNWLDHQASMSVWTTAISVLEIRFGLATMPLGRRRARLEKEFDHIIIEDLLGRVLAFDETSAEQTASLMARAESLGRVTELRDSMIAGISHGWLRSTTDVRQSMRKLISSAPGVPMRGQERSAVFKTRRSS